MGGLRVHVEPGRYKTAVGGDVMFRCVVNGNSVERGAQVRWMRADGRALPERAVLRSDRLIIRRVDSTDQGRYVCLVTTERGQRRQADAELIVSGIVAASSTSFCESGVNKVGLCSLFLS